MSELDNAFRILKKEKICKSQHAFSRDYLGRAPNYYGALKCMQNKNKSVKPSTHVLLVLHFKLTELARHTNEPNDFDSYHAKQSLITLSNSLLAEIKEKCKTKQP
jgi:hypothetical protein